jgi:hypothetical protein
MGFLSDAQLEPVLEIVGQILGFVTSNHLYAILYRFT